MQNVQALAGFTLQNRWLLYDIVPTNSSITSKDGLILAPHWDILTIKLSRATNKARTN